MRVFSPAFSHGARIPGRHAFAVPHPTDHVAWSENVSPALIWEGAPAGTRSFVIVCHDPDVPSRGDDVNQDGRRVPADLPRVDFYHWALFDVGPDVTQLAEGEGGHGITPGGKAGPEAPGGRRHARNDYRSWFASDPAMAGDWFGYDGPCPPWNDTLVHHYWFTVHALDVARLEVSGLDARDVVAALAGHVLGSASVMGTYAFPADAVDLTGTAGR